MIIGSIKEENYAENRTALTPRVVKQLTKDGHIILLEKGIGLKSGFSDYEYKSAGAQFPDDVAEIYPKCHIILQILPPKNTFLQKLTSNKLLISNFRNFTFEAERQYPRILRLEHVPRTSVAQSVDVLSSQGTVRGYMGALYALYNSPRLCPQMMTAAVSIKAAAALVIGASVTGLQAASVFKRMGCRVTIADINNKNSEVVQSVGAEFALAADEEAYSALLKNKNFVLTAAATPDGEAPIILRKTTLTLLAKGAVIVDTTSHNVGIDTPNETTFHYHFYRNPFAERLAPETASELWASNMYNLLTSIIIPNDALDLSINYIKPMLYQPNTWSKPIPPDTGFPPSMQL